MTCLPSSPAKPSLAPWQVYGLALLLGLAGLLLNLWKVHLLTEETPDFVFGGVMVLLSFLLLGTRPGVLTGLVALTPIFQAGFQHYPALMLAIPVYLLEAWVTVRLCRSLGSLVFASSVFWYGLGWLLDVVAYGAGMGLPRDYLVLLFVKQVFNGLANAAFAELLLLVPAVRRFPVPRPAPAAVPLRSFVFGRAALVVVGPAVALALLFSRSLFERHLELERAREVHLAAEVAAVLAHLPADGAPGEARAGARREAYADVLASFPAGAARISVLDAAGGVLASTAADLDRRAAAAPEVAAHLADGAQQQTFSYFPAADGSRENRMRIDLRHAALYRLPRPALAVLVEVPALALHSALLPSAYLILGFLFSTLVLLYAVVASFGRRVAAPLAVLETASREIAGGRFPPARLLARLGASPIAEIRSLATDFSRMQHALAFHDAATDLPNRQLFADFLAQALSRAAREGRELAVVVVDLDGFRPLQESLGQEAGTVLLREVAARLEASLPEDGIAGRLGPDVFALAAPAADASAAAWATIEAAQARLARPFPVAGREVFVTASAGASLFPADGRNAEELLRNASAAMERVKERGKDGAALFSPDLAGGSRERLSLLTDLRRAVERGELAIHYQPILELASGGFVGMEAFVRWTHPERGAVAPEEFIRLAERSDLITRIDAWVLSTAARQLAAWLAEGLSPLTLAVNLSPRQLQRPDLPGYLSSALAGAGLPPHLLAVELTETAAIQDPERSVRVLSELRQLGVGICLDDFGTGYSSLSQLQRLPLDILKLDRSFVAGLSTDPADAAIAGAILALARSLDLTVVAEGVETREQLEFLRRRGCQRVQGFYVGEPVPAEAFALLARRDQARRAVPLPA